MRNAKKGYIMVLVMALTATSLFAGGGKQQSASSGTAPGQLAGEIRFSWWGNETRNTATIKAIEFYESLHPGVKIIPEYGAVDGYQTKMLAQIAAGNAPDIFTMSAEDLPIYVDTGGLTDLTGLIDVSTHNPVVAQACSINGKMYGVNLSLNANVIYYNKTQADELGIKMPTGDYTWDDLVKILAEVYQKSGEKTYGMVDNRMVKAMETFIPVWNITHLGKEPPFPWTDKEFLMTGADVAAYMDYWNKVPKGVLMPPAETATISSQIDSPIASRRTFLAFDTSGTFAMYQSQTKDDLQMIEYPNNHKGKGAAVSARPGLIESVYAGSKNKTLAIDFLQWISSDPEAGKILKTVRGVLPSSKQVEALLADPTALSDVDKKVFAITNAVYSKPVNPYSAGVLVSNIWDETHMMATGAEVAFGRITPQQAGQRFEEYVKDALP
ncbi:sugar ABC transporter substrate-binding protein [Spirochaetia bacterium]|nr:sugar ABC transporter substrate-binding protein [Spirochaetia bacterium]